MPTHQRARGERRDAGASEPAREKNPRNEDGRQEGGEANPTASNPDPGSAAGQSHSEARATNNPTTSPGTSTNGTVN